MLVEACHTTILIIISVAHSKKSKGSSDPKQKGTRVGSLRNAVQ